MIFIGIAQLMVILDATIVNVALPHMQTSLHFSDATRQWLITAYGLAFGGLLLLGGRIADQCGRKRAFMIGLGGFALASVLLNTLAASATAGLAQQAAVHGYTVAFWCAAGILTLAAVTALVLVNAGATTGTETANTEADETAALAAS